MRMIISGATGFVGAHLMRHFSRKGFEVVGMGRARSAPEGLSQFGEYISADLSSKLSKKIKADTCVHCAGYANDKGSWEDFYRNNVITTQNIFQGIDAPLFINLSSASIYPLLPHPIQESDVDLNAFPSFYGKSKWQAEEFTRKYVNEKDIVISLRPRAIYGTHDRILLPRILNIAKSGTIKLPGDGRVKLSMTNIKNLILAIELAVTANKKGFHVYNVADDTAYELRTVFQKLVSGIHNREIPVKAIPENLVKLIIKVTTFFGHPKPLTRQAFDYITKPTTLNTAKIKKELNYQPRSNFTNSLPDIITWAQSIDEKMWQENPERLPWTNV